MKSLFRLRGKSTTDLSEWSRNDEKLLRAVQCGDRPKVQSLMTKKTLTPSKPGPSGLSVYHVAAAKGHLTILDLFLSHGVEVNCTDIQGHTALHLAAKNGWPLVVDQLLRVGANHMVVDTNRMTALHHACGSVQYPCVEILLRHGANVNVKDKSGRTPLFYCAQTGDSRMCKLLLDKGALPNVQDHVGRTPLMFAAIQGHADVAECLMLKGANPNTVDKEGNTALLYAKNANAQNVVDVISKIPVTQNELPENDHDLKSSEKESDLTDPVITEMPPISREVKCSDSESSISTDLSGTFSASTLPRPKKPTGPLFKPRQRRSKGPFFNMTSKTKSDPSIRTSLMTDFVPIPAARGQSRGASPHPAGETVDSASTLVARGSSSESSPVSSPVADRKGPYETLKQEHDQLLEELRTLRVDKIKLQDRLSYLQQNSTSDLVHSKKSGNGSDIQATTEQLNQYKEKLKVEEERNASLLAQLDSTQQCAHRDSNSGQTSATIHHPAGSRMEIATLHAQLLALQDEDKTTKLLDSSLINQKR